MICEPDQDDVTDADLRPMICDCDDPGECWTRVFVRDRYDTNAGGRCIDFILFELIDDIDAEDMADLDDPRSLASLDDAQAARMAAAQPETAGA